MYFAHYKLKELPFSLHCDERFFYESSVHAETLANMMYTVQHHKGMVLVTGEIGAGKTLLAMMLRQRLEPECVTISIQNPPQSAGQMIRMICQNLGLRIGGKMPLDQLTEKVYAHLQRLAQRGRLVAMTIDECQDLSDEALAELRRFANWEQAGLPLIQMVLVGQPELRERLLQPGWESIRQRIVLSYHLTQLSPNDTYGYIDYRLGVAADVGCLAVFTDEAKRKIFEATHGTPRLINVLCDNALLMGFSQGVYEITDNIVVDAVNDMMITPSVERSHKDTATASAEIAEQLPSSQQGEAAELPVKEEPQDDFDEMDELPASSGTISRALRRAMEGQESKPEELASEQLPAESLHVPTQGKSKYEPFLPEQPSSEQEAGIDRGTASAAAYPQPQAKTYGGTASISPHEVAAALNRTASAGFPRTASRRPKGYARPSEVNLAEEVVVHRRPGSSLAEEFRSLRKTLLPPGREEHFCYLVTSSQPGEGKTVTCVNLGVAMTERVEKRTILVDFNLRNGGTMANMLRLKRTPGMAELLRGTADLEEVIQPTAYPNLFFIASGAARPEEVGELVGGGVLDELVIELQRRYDYILFDTPAVSQISDASTLAMESSEALLVVRMYKTKRESVENALRILEASHVNFSGIVLTNRKHFIPNFLYRIT